MSNLIDRIFKNWKTTLIGLLIIVGALGAVYLEKATLTEAGAFITLGITLFFVKDKQDPPASQMRWVWIVLIVFLTSGTWSCRPKLINSSTVITTITKDSTVIKDSLVYHRYTVPVDSLVLIGFVECDTLTLKPKPIKLSGKHGRAINHTVLDSTGRLSASTTCEALTDSIAALHRTINRERSSVLSTDTKVTHGKPFNRWFWVAVLSLVLNLIFVLLLFKK